MLEWYYLVLVSSLLFGIAAIIEKYTLKKEFATAYSTAFAFLIAVISVVFIPFAKFNVNLSSLILIFVFSLISTLTYLITARILRHSPISTSSPILSVLPTVFIVILAFFFLGEHLTILQYISVAVIVAAAYLLLFMVPKSTQTLKGMEKKKYVLILVANSLVLGIGWIISKYILYTVDPYTFLILTQFFVAVEFIVIITLRYNGVKEMIATTKHHKIPITAIAILTTISRIAFYIALAKTPVSLAQPLSNTLYVIVAVLIGGMIFQEGSLKEKLALSIVMVIFATLLVIA